VVQPLRDYLILMGGTWTGNFQELLDALSSRISDQQKKSKAWPATTRGLSAILKRLAPCLRQVGITVEVGARGKSGRAVIIQEEGGEKGGGDTPPTATTHPPTEIPQGRGVGGGGGVDRQGDGLFAPAPTNFPPQTLKKPSGVWVGGGGVRLPATDSPH